MSETVEQKSFSKRRKTNSNKEK